MKLIRKTILSLVSMIVILGLAAPSASAAGYTEFNPAVPDMAESIEFTVKNPANLSQNKVYKYTESAYPTIIIPAGHLLDIKITMQPTYVIIGTGSTSLNIDDFDVKVSGEKENAKLTYTLKDFKPKESTIYLYGWQTQPFNYASYDLAGGEWTDTEPSSAYLGQEGCKKQIFIVPFSTVYKPSDPVRKGYTFAGWSGSSHLGKGANGNPKTFTIDNPYKFNEKDPNLTLGIRDNVVSLVANWVPLPKATVNDVEIFVGEQFSLTDLLKAATDGKNKDLKDPINGGKISYIGDYDPNTPGDYPVTITIIDKWGGKVTKTAKLTVKPVPIKPQLPVNTTIPTDKKQLINNNAASANKKQLTKVSQTALPQTGTNTGLASAVALSLIVMGVVFRLRRHS